MGTDIAVLTIHGMGEQNHLYALPLIKDVKRRLGNKKDYVFFRSIYYQDILQENQEDVFFRMSGYPISWKGLRKFLLYSFSDPVSIETKKEPIGSPYKEVQKKIVGALDDVYDHFGCNKVPVVIVAQSLGGQVISNYLWDAGWRPKCHDEPTVGVLNQCCDNMGETKGSDKDEFRRLKSLRALITTGCNIPLFVAGHNKIVPIYTTNNDFEWLNYFDRDDALGWPLSPLNGPYDKLVQDREINAGGVLTNWNPLSHLEYWTDNDFLEPLVDFLRELIAAPSS